MRWLNAGCGVEQLMQRRARASSRGARRAPTCSRSRRAPECSPWRRRRRLCRQSWPPRTARDVARRPRRLVRHPTPRRAPARGEAACRHSDASLLGTARSADRTAPAPLAYSEAVSTHQAAPPTHSAAISDAASERTWLPDSSSPRNCWSGAMRLPIDLHRGYAACGVDSGEGRGPELRRFEHSPLGAVGPSAAAPGARRRLRRRARGRSWPTSSVSSPRASRSPAPSPSATRPCVDPSAKPGSHRAFLLVAPHGIDHRRRHHGRQERTRRAGAAQLLEHHHELGQPVALTAVLLG